MGQVTLTCAVSGGTGSDTPTCSVPATSAAFASSTAQTVTVTIGSTAATAAVMKSDRTLVAGGTGICALGGFLLCGLFVGKRRLAAAMFMVLLAGPFLFTLSGCGGGGAAGAGGTGGGGGTTGTPAGSYTVTVTATNPNYTYNQGWVSNPITAITTVSLTVN